MSVSDYQYSFPPIGRFPAREINIGGIPLGGDNPIRLQSMTNTRSSDIRETVKQCIRIIEAGAHYVRISVPAREDIESFTKIKKELNAAGFIHPLIADIHFKPELAEMAASIAAKVRINPGNYTDRIRTGSSPRSVSEYQQELENIRSRISPLTHLCSENGTVIRIGTNMGSLSQRIIQRYGNTPEAMVESTVEFLDILESLNFYQTVISLKASNPLIMIKAYRLMAQRMIEKGMAYPLHLGVTEAGAGNEGRVKSALGLASLLKSGIGDTIRVSLTEDPEKEIPFARKLAEPFNEAFQKGADMKKEFKSDKFNFSDNHPPLPGGHKAVVISQMPETDILKNDLQTDIIATEVSGEFHFKSQDEKYLLIPARQWDQSLPKNVFPIFKKEELSSQQNSLHLTFNFAALNSMPDDHWLDSIPQRTQLIVVPLINEGFLPENIDTLSRKVIYKDKQHAVIPKKTYTTGDTEHLIIDLAANFGSFLMQRKIHGLWVNAPHLSAGQPEAIVFAMLQAAGIRNTRTEFISCPTCARTSFDLEKIFYQIREHFSGIPGLKIAVMGCVVNGPGEMADADYGVLGTAAGKVHIFKGQKPLKKNIEPSKVVDQLSKILVSEGVTNTT